jgi:hypothetical protein
MYSLKLILVDVNIDVSRYIILVVDTSILASSNIDWKEEGVVIYVYKY